MNLREYSRVLGLILSLLAWQSAAVVQGQVAVLMEHSWQSFPDLGVQWIDTPNSQFTSDEIFVHVKLLDSADQSDVFEAAQALATIGQQMNGPHRVSAFAKVVTLLRDPSQSRQLKQSLATAATKLFTGESNQADEIWQLVQGDPTIRPFVENWAADAKLHCAAEIWKSRLQDPSKVPEKDLSLALEGVAKLELGECAQSVEKLIRSEVLTPAQTLQACHCLGRLADSGLIDLARQFLNSPSPFGQIMAARLLFKHKDDESKAIMSDLLKSTSDPARRLAWLWLIEHASDESTAMIPRFLKDNDSGIRRMAIDKLAIVESSDAVELLGGCLRDINAQNRRAARDNLIQRASRFGENSQVAQQVDIALDPDFGLGTEQAIEIVVALKLGTSIERLLRLLEHPVPAIRVRAAWAIANVGLQNDDQLNEVLKFCQFKVDELTQPNAQMTRENNSRLAYLIEALGKAKYQPAAELFRKLVRKATMPPSLVRASGIWSLGLILEGANEAPLCQELCARMLDSGPFGEDVTVRYASAIAVGWIRHTNCLGPLGRVDQPPAAVGIAAKWSTQQINDSARIEAK